MAHNTLSPCASEFIEKLLLPLADGEQAADSPAWRRALVKDRVAVWGDAFRIARFQVELAEHEFHAAHLRRSLARVAGTIDDEEEAAHYLAYHRTFAALGSAIDALFAVPAPRRDDIAFKRKRLKAASSRERKAMRTAYLRADEAAHGIDRGDDHGR